MVDRFCQVEGRTNVWAIGDAAAVPDPARPGQPTPPTCQHALRQGRTVAGNVAAALGAGRPKPFTYKTLGVFVDMGHQKAVAETVGIKWRGFPAWFLARTYHLAMMPGIKRQLRLMVDWTVDLLFGRDTSELGQLGHPPELEMPPAGGPTRRETVRPLSAGAVALVLASAGLHAFWNWLVADARDSHAVAAVALLTAAIVFAPVAVLTWDVEAGGVAVHRRLGGARARLLRAAGRRLRARRPQLRLPDRPRGGARARAGRLARRARRGRSRPARRPACWRSPPGCCWCAASAAAPRAAGWLLALGVAACIAAYTLVDDEGVRHAAALPLLRGGAADHRAAVRRRRRARPRARGAAGRPPRRAPPPPAWPCSAPTR